MQSVGFSMIITSLKANSGLKRSLILRGLWISDAIEESVTESDYLSEDKAQRIMPGHVKAERKQLQTRKKLLNK
jgi:hypothetical protein